MLFHLLLALLPLQQLEDSQLSQPQGSQLWNTQSALGFLCIYMTWTLSPIFTFVTNYCGPCIRWPQGVLSSGFVTLDHSRSMGPQGRWLGYLSISHNCCDISENIMTGLSAPSGYMHFLGQMVSHFLFMKPTAVACFLSAVRIIGLSAIPGAEMCSKTVVYQ